jgi:hypothetical protein
LNFEGAQRTRPQEEATSSHRPGTTGGQSGHMFTMATTGEENGPASSIPLNEERELMQGVKDIVVEEAGSIQGMQPLFGPDGKQHRVLFGTNATSEEEMSSTVSIPNVSLMRRSNVEFLPASCMDDYEMPHVKVSSPTRSVDKHKRECISPYRSPKRNVVGHIQEGSGEGGVTLEIKKEEKVMEDQVIQSSSLALFPTDPNTLTGPRCKAHQEP